MWKDFQNYPTTKSALENEVVLKPKNNTPPKFNIAPENGWLEDYFPFGKAYFHGLC